MTEDTLAGNLLFQVTTPLGFRVSVTRKYWELIITVKHPVMAGREAHVEETLRNPGDGFLITTYPTDAIKEGPQVWHK